MSDIWRISEAVSLAFHTMVFLAQHPERKSTTHEIAEKYRVSEHHLAKIHQRLVRAGLLEASRGPSGGFRLAKPADKVTLLEVLEAIEGPSKGCVCVFREPTCGRGKCIFGDLLESVNSQISEYFTKTTLAELTEDPGPMKEAS